MDTATPQLLSKPKKALFTAFSVFIVVALFGCLEFLVRAVQARRYGGTSVVAMALRDRFTAWWNNPAYRRMDIHHNAQGFRHAEDTSIEKPANTIRIFLLGGSTAYGAQGSFSHIENRFSRIYGNQLIDAYLQQKLSAAQPSRHWEVINAAASGYRIHQELALLESRILRYHPDCVLLLDGYNDFIALLHAAERGGQLDFDVYDSTPGREEFDTLANPRSLVSLLASIHTWIQANSALVRLAEDRIPGAVGDPWRSARAVESAGARHAGAAGLVPVQRAGAEWALREVSYFPRVARQIFRITTLDGVVPVFLLQPILILSQKSFTATERQMFDYDRASGGSLYSYLFPEAYHRLGMEMSEAARLDGFTFVNFERAFDQTNDQTFTDFAHLTPRGNEILAEQLVPLLLRLFPRDRK